MTATYAETWCLQKVMSKRLGFPLSLLCGLLLLNAQQTNQTASEPALLDDRQLTVSHPECSFFGNQAGLARPQSTLSSVTEGVTAQMSFVPAGSRTRSFMQVQSLKLIDSFLYPAMQSAGVTPAAKTTDFEFIRRVTLDLTGRIPDPQRVLTFVADATPDKRTRLIDELLAKPEWVDKWTMYCGDRYKNTVRNTQINRYSEARNTFYQWIHDSLAPNKPYDQMAHELIAAQGANSFSRQDGAMNWMVGGVVTGGPVQDIMDQQTANSAETLLGISHLNCLLCHNGRGHLDQLSLWGSQTTRYQVWQLASFVSHTQTTRARITGGATGTPGYYWSIADDTARFKSDYSLNTTTGNSPPRTP